MTKERQVVLVLNSIPLDCTPCAAPNKSANLYFISNIIQKCQD